MSYSKLGDEEAGGWPSKASLCELFEEREVELLEQITSGGGVGKLAEMLGSSTTAGISGEAADLAQRKSVYGVNAFAEKRLKSYLELVWDGLHDLTLILLMVMSAVSWVMETFFGDHPETGWIESVAIFVSVFIIVNVAASTDYVKERTFRDLSAQLDASNKKVVIRGGAQLEVQDCEIVVGDVLSFNAHNLASIPCDGLLLPGSEGVKMDEASLTGEPEPQLKSVDDAPWIVSGTSAVAGSGKVLVVAVGAASVSGKIREAVYGEDVEEEGSPLFQKLDALVVLIGKAGIAAALSCFTVMCFVGLIVKGEPLMMILEYTITTITIVAVAVPEGLPLAVTLALAFSSTKMMDENNLVKHLDACETMGSATTICSDKTGTLTANRMTVKAAWAFGAYLPPDNSSQVPLGVTLQSKLGKEARLMLATLVSVCSMDESYLAHNALTGKTDFKGNPTECALLSMTRDLGYEFAALRDATEGRSDSSRPSGASILFSSARKMMSWLVKRPSGGYRLYAKGASEIILERCSHIASEPHEAGLGRIELGDERKAVLQREVINTFAAEAMRTMGLAYRDFDQRPDCDALHPSATNANGTKAPQIISRRTKAFAVETSLTLVAIAGIEDPLRPEVKPAIERCFRAGIDVRMVTGDNLDTATAIASRCGILRDEHFEHVYDDDGGEYVRTLKPYRAMEGKTFRKMVYRPSTVDGEPPSFDQEAFDRIWPYLRVMARSSPEDKLTLANGLNRSALFADKQRCEELRREDGIIIFPDRQARLILPMTP